MQGSLRLRLLLIPVGFYSVRIEYKKNNLFIYLVLFYFPSMMLSNIVAIKLNYVFALLIMSFSLLAFLRKKIHAVAMVIALILVLIKSLVYGVYGIKPLIIALMGSLTVIHFIKVFDDCSKDDKNHFLQITFFNGLLVALIVIGQTLGFLPSAIGAITFVNTAGFNLLGEYSSGARPSGYFYHPYDTALALIPIIAAAKLITGWGRVIGAVGAVVISIMLGLKILMIFTVLLLIIPLVLSKYANKNNVIILYVGLMFGMLIVTGTRFSEFLISMSAGRLYIWEIMMEQYIHNSSAGSVMLGYNEDLLINSLFWDGDESYTTHNQYLYTIIYMGLTLFTLFIYIFSKLLVINKELNLIILLMFITFALSGDLVVFLGFWVCLSQVYVMLSWRSAKGGSKNGNLVIRDYNG